MLRFETFVFEKECVAINPNYIAHIIQSRGDKTVLVTMCDGRRYELPAENGVITFASYMEQIANNGRV